MADELILNHEDLSNLHRHYINLTCVDSGEHAKAANGGKPKRYNFSAFVVDVEGVLLAITAGHVFEKLRQAVALGSILSGAILCNGSLGQIGQQIFSSGSQLLTLKYSRGQETEADNLGIAYLNKAGYDPRAMSTVLGSLAAQNTLDARLMGSTDKVPEWASTHPDPASRVRTALTRAGSTAKGVTNRDLFLSRIAGLTYGDDPKQGIVDGHKFTHPDLKLTFTAPNGFYLVNGTRAVAITGQAGKAQFTTAAYAGDMDAYVRAAFASLTESGQQQITPGAISRTTVNGIPAAYALARVASGGSQVDVVVFAYEWAKDSAFHFITIVPAGNTALFDGMFQSMRRITAAEATAVKPRKLVVDTVKKGDTVQSLAKRMAYTDAQEDRFRVLNGLAAGATVTVGQKVKLVTY